MSLAIFDLDNTLLAGDSDYLWGRFLVEQDLVDRPSYERENRRFYDEYTAGTLDIFEFLSFQLAPLARHDPNTLYILRERYLQEKIWPIVLPKARALLQQHRDHDDLLLIVTATNYFITAPIAEELGVDDLIATEPEIEQGRYTGRVSGIPCFREGKVQRLTAWLEATGNNLANSCFYSDSHNDLPLLELVSRPVAVDPDDTLAAHAALKGWPVISLR